MKSVFNFRLFPLKTSSFSSPFIFACFKCSNFCNNGCINNFLTSICPQTEVKDHPASLRVTCCQYTTSPPVVFGFLDRNYRYKSCLPKFLTMLGWHGSTLPGIEPETAACESVTLCTTAADNNNFVSIIYFPHSNMRLSCNSE